MRVLLIGSGGREHALAWKMSQSPSCEKLFCAPGNPGIADHAECISLNVDDIDGIVSFAIDHAIDLVVVGPEVPLVLGLADRLSEKNIPVFGPSQSAARLEGSKAFTKGLCDRFDIPTAAYGRFTDASEAENFIREKGAPIVIKADGLAAGKGVIIAQSVEEAVAAAKDMLSGATFGSSGDAIVIEEFMDGEELSFFALCDGKTVIPFTSAQDHKRVGDGDTGPNTGGMGAYSPAHLITPELQQKIMERIIVPTVKGMTSEGTPFQGVLFAGIMVVGSNPYLIEYNARFGDPECQVMMPRLESDLLDVLNVCAVGDLARFENGLKWKDDNVLGVVMAAKGYPGAYQKGSAIAGIEKTDAVDNTKVFHAGTSRATNGDTLSNGGRVLTVVAEDRTIAGAQQKAYAAVDMIDWPEGFCRRDIGWRAVKAAS